MSLLAEELKMNGANSIKSYQPSVYLKGGKNSRGCLYRPAPRKRIASSIRQTTSSLKSPPQAPVMLERASPPYGIDQTARS